MSRLSTKQRRAAGWRHAWCAHVRELRAEGPGPGTFTAEEWSDLAPLMADYSRWIERAKPPAGLGRRKAGSQFWPWGRDETDSLALGCEPGDPSLAASAEPAREPSSPEPETDR